MNSLPFVSIVVPVYNGKRTIRECIKSLLRQTYPKEKHEIVIVDNNSTDGTPEIIKQYPVTLLYEKEIQTSYAARNKGIKHAKGEIVAFTDADCIADKNWLEKLVIGCQAVLIGGCMGKILLAKSFSFAQKISTQLDMWSNAETLKHSFMPFAPTANVAFKKEVFDKIGLFDSQLISGGDADISWRMQIQSKFQLNFNKEAIIYHQEKLNFKSLIDQRMRYGYGVVLLRKKYNFKVDIMDDFKYTLRFVIRQAIIFIKDFFLNFGKRKNAIFLLLPVFKSCLEIAYFIGIYRGIKKGR